MSTQDYLQQVARGLAEDWEIALPEQITEAEILHQLEFQISKLLQGSPEVFFGLMYRLDIPENKLKEAITRSEDVVRVLARLVYQRQLQKANSRLHFRSSERPADDTLRW